MKTDYLWDKRGSDSEIERIETLLSEYRYVPVPAPNVAPPEEVSWWRWLLPAIAFAALLLTVVWIGSVHKSPVAVSKEEALAELVPAPAVAAVPETPAGTAVETPASARPAQTRLMSTPIRAKVSSNRKRPIKSATVALTDEEKYAYEQVVRALYITGTQLRSVHSAIAGIEDHTTTDKNR
jgi:hypothetical protein